MQPAKKRAWTSPTLYFSPHTNPHSATVELLVPPIHSHEPGCSPQTVSAESEHGSATHLQSGSRSAKIITMVWKASKAHAKHVKTKCLNWYAPNSPQYFWSISSMQTFSTSADFLINGDRRLGSPESDVGAGILIVLQVLSFALAFCHMRLWL